MRDSSPPKAADPAETAAASLAARVLHRTLAALHAAGNGGATCRAIGARVDVPHQHVGDWCQELSGRTPKLTKVLRMGPSIAPAVLRALAAEVEATAERSVDVRDAALGVQEAAGHLASKVRAALADGVVDEGERAGIEAALLAAEAELAQVRASLAGARRACSRCRGRWPGCPCRALPWIDLCALDLGTLLGAIPGDPADDAAEVYDDAACEPTDGAR